MSSEEVAIRVNNVSKQYCVYERPDHRLKQSVMPRLQRLVGRPARSYYRAFDALRGISFEVSRGETVGIIGRNGSGKSTLLQVVCGTLQPTVGTVEVCGRIAALLELGAGFNPEFTGRENIYMHGAILGLASAEIHARFDDIARFADIGQFIEQPVRTYSSGMYVRLAFAVAINVDPDILVVDEALAVGDEAFQRKCFARIEDIQDKGGTILFVSHGSQTVVQLCNRAILVDAGEVILDGQPKAVVSQYQRLVNLRHEEAGPVHDEIRRMRAPAGRAATAGRGEPTNAAAISENGAPKHEEAGWFDPTLVSSSTVSYECHGARIRDVRIATPRGAHVNVLALGKSYSVEYHVEFVRSAEQVLCGMLIKSISGLELAGANNANAPGARLAHVEAGQKLKVTFSFVCRIMPGTYLLTAGIMGTQLGEQRFLHRLLDVLVFRVAPQDTLFDWGYFSLSADFKTELTQAEGRSPGPPRQLEQVGADPTDHAVWTTAAV